MQTEIRLRPPYQISMSELCSANGYPYGSLQENKDTRKMSPGEMMNLSLLIQIYLFWDKGRD